MGMVVVRKRKEKKKTVEVLQLIELLYTTACGQHSSGEPSLRPGSRSFSNPIPLSLLPTASFIIYTVLSINFMRFAVLCTCRVLTAFKVYSTIDKREWMSSTRAVQLLFLWSASR